MYASVKKTSYLEKFIILLFLLMPIINQYYFGALTFLDYFSFTAVVYVVIKTSFKYSFKNKGLLAFCIFLLMTTIISSLFINDLEPSRILFKVFRLVLYLFLFFYALNKCFDKVFLYKCYKYIVLLLTSIAVIQFITSSFFGFVLPTYLSNMGVYGNEMSGNDLYSLRVYQLSAGIYRPSSLFLEPAWFALYVLPFICWNCYLYKFTKKNFMLLCYIMIGMIVTRSFIGILCGIVILLLYTLSYLKKKPTLFFSLILILSVSVMLLIPSFVNMIEEKMNHSFTDTNSSFYQRIIRGYDCFSELGVYFKLFGVGFGNITAHFKLYEIGINSAINDNLSYMNGLFTLLCYYGVIGTLLFFYVFLVKRKIKTKALYFIFMFLFIMGTSDYLDTGYFYLFIVVYNFAVPYSFHKYKKKELIYDRLFS